MKRTKMKKMKKKKNKICIFCGKEIKQESGIVIMCLDCKNKLPSKEQNENNT